MGRRRFDQDQVLQQALNSFWQHGYHATSMQQLFNATGLKPGSLYMAFGSKAGLFRAAVDHYIQMGAEMIDQKVAEYGHAGKAIVEILRGYIAEAQTEDYRGCLSLNSQSELSKIDDAELHEFICSSLQRIEQRYADHLAQTYGPDKAEERAASLMLQIAGLRTYAHFGRQRDHAEMLLRESLPWLPWEAGQH